MKRMPILPSLFAGLAAWTAPGMADDIVYSTDPILVEDTRIQEPLKAELRMDRRARGPVTDGGDLLKTIPGIAGSRMGGHGMDPVIRGQSQTRINILLDGAYVHGGCPNRMDPPSAYATSETYDEIEVIKSAQTVRYGGGGSGGTVLFKRNTEPFTEDTWYRGKIGTGYRSNSDVREGFADISAGGARGFIRLIGNHSNGEDYENGDGDTVRAHYQENTGNIILGWTPSERTLMEFSYEKVGARDIYYPGAGMDEPYSDHDVGRLKFEHRLQGGILNAIEAQVSYSVVDHLMDNFSLRAAPSPMMHMRAPTSSDTWSARAELELVHGDFLSNVGFNYQHNTRDAERQRQTASGGERWVQSYLWPDVRISTIGAYGESVWEVANDRRFKFGLRYDHVRSSAGKLDAAPDDTMGTVLSPADLYETYYGGSPDSQEEDNVGALARFEQDYWREAGVFFVSASRSVRTADATERFMASNHNSDADSRWVGNPFLDPEAHHQIDIGTQIDSTSWDLDLSLYFDRVDDFILRDRDHGEHGAGNATIYRNVDANLFGGELSINRHWNRQWRSGINLAYVRARNTTDGRDIAQIPPLDTALTTDFDSGNLNLGIKIRLVAEQHRVDDDPATGSGLDARETPGFQTLDLYAGYRLSNGFSIKFGVDNVFDHDYAEHLNTSNAFDVTQVQVDEPGRSFWLTGEMKF
ncbi:MAG: iron complex outermembrane recepter protein [Candidatus Kentron sp. G]|nr:MAG: iron complex outermembrane recepter protein [Candidatus Kentron sp. G]VFN03169.1 MAG: iron complex outermembrane recepter protein [Candidatus Kentron sp. G]